MEQDHNYPPQIMQGESLDQLTQQYNKLSITDAQSQFLNQIKNKDKASPSTQNKPLDPNYHQHISNFISINFTLNDWQSIIKCFNSDDILQKHYGVIGIRKLLSLQDSPPIQQVIDAGLIPPLIQLANQSLYPQLQMQALWSLTNVASGTCQQTHTVFQQGGLPIFLNQLQNSILPIAEQSTWAIGNLAADRTIYRDWLIQNGAVQKLVQFIQKNNSNHKIMSNGIWALTNLCRGNPIPEYSKVKNGVNLCCFAIVQAKNLQQEMLLDCLWACSHHQELKDEVPFDFGIKLIHKLLQIIKTGKIGYKIPSLRILSTFLQVNQLCDYFVMNNGINELINFLSNEKKAVRKQTVFILQEIAQKPYYKVQQIFSNPTLLSKLLEMIQNDEIQIRIQVGYFFHYLSDLQDLHKVYLLYKQCGIIKHLIPLLSLNKQSIIIAAIECIEGVIDVGSKFLQNYKNIFVEQFQLYGGLQNVQQLQYHSSEQVYQNAVKFLQKYNLGLEQNEIDQQNPSDIVPQGLNNNFGGAAPM